MAGYEPIRDSFRELNRLVIDSTTWDERHAATAASNRRQEMMDRNTMAQQEWSNSMAERKMVLDERGEKRLSDKLSADMAHMSIMEDIALTKVGQDERKLKDQLATNAKQRELLSLELDEKLYETEAVDLNVSGLLTPKELQSETVLGNINAGPQFGGSGRTLGPDGFVRDEFGEVVKMRRKDQVELAPILQGAGAKMDLNTGRVLTRLENNEKTYQALTKEINDINFGDPGSQKRKADLRRQRNVVKADSEKHAQFFTPEGQMENYLKNANDLRIAAQKLDGLGTRGKETADGYRQDAIALEKRASDLQTEIFGVKKENIKAKGGGSGTLPSGTMTENQMFDVAAAYESEGMQNIINSNAVKPKIATMKNIISEQYTAKGRDGTLRASIREDVIAKVEQFETKYWEDVDQINNMTTPQVKAALTAWKIPVTKGMNAKQAKERLKLAKNNVFSKKVKQLAGNDKMNVYRPNTTTRKMLQGVN